MRDPVALAWSGRVADARALACEQAGGADPAVAGQGLEALAVLGSQHGVTADARIDALLLAAAAHPSTARRAFEAAAALQSDVLRPLACARLEEGAAGWEVLRYARERPHPELTRALDTGWSRLAPSLHDEALRTACTLPFAATAARLVFARRARALLAATDTSVQVSALLALQEWRYRPAAPDCRRLLSREEPEVAVAAAHALRSLSRKQAEQVVDELGDELPRAVLAALRGER